MNKKISNNESENKDGFDFIEYPCEFAFKAVAKSKTGIENELRSVVASVISENNVLSSKLMKSKNGKFESVTIAAKLQSREELEAVYKALSDYPDVLMTL